MLNTKVLSIILLLLIISLVVAGLPLIGPQLRHVGGPVLWLSQDVVDFGVVAPNEYVRTELTIENRGGEVLKVINITMSCGCTEIQSNKNEIDPGDVATLSIGVQVRAGYGSVEEIAHIHTNDMANPAQVVKIKFVVGNDVIVEPPSVDFGTVAREHLPRSQTLRILHHSSGQAISNLDIKDHGQFFRASLGPFEGRNSRTMVVTLPEHAPLGQMKGTLLLRDIANQAPGIPVSIQAYVRGIVYATPTSLMIGPIRKDAAIVSRSFTITARAGAFEVTEAAVGDPIRDYLDTHVVRVDNSNDWSVEISTIPDRVPHLWKSMSVLGHILVKCKVPDENVESLNIPVVVLIEANNTNVPQEMPSSGGGNTKP